MKVKFLIPAVAIVLFFAIQSCKKSTTEVKQTINLAETIAVPDTFTYVLPSNQSDDPYQITTQAKHFLKSELSTDANGNIIYTYIYSANGENTLSDDVVIANVEEVHTGGKPPHPPGVEPPHKHNCDSAEVVKTINIHFTVK